MRLKDLVINQKENIVDIADRYGAYNIRLFGSVVNGTDDPESDIDFLVDLEEGRTLFDLGGLLMDLQELLHNKVDVITKAGLRNRIRDRVLKEAIVL